MNVNVTVDQILASNKCSSLIGETRSNAMPLVVTESAGALLGELSRLAFTKSHLVAWSVLTDMNVYIKMQKFPPRYSYLSCALKCQINERSLYGSVVEG